METRPNGRGPALPRRERGHVADPTTDPAAESAHPSILDLAAASIAQVDLLIGELQHVRGVLHREGERLDHAITRYAGANQSLFATIDVVRDIIEPIATAQSSCMTPRSPPFEHI